MRRPPLCGGARRDRRARHTEHLRLDIVIAAIQSPYAPVVGLHAVFLPDEQPACHQVLESVGARYRRLKAEVIERSAVSVSFLARKAIFEVEIDARFFTVQLRRIARLVLCRRARSNLKPGVMEWILARGNRVEPLPKHETVDGHRWRDQPGREFPPEACLPAGVLQYETCHAEQRLTQKRPTDAAGDLIVFR